MVIDGGVTSSARQALVFLVRNMATGLRGIKLLSKTKVDEIDCVALLKNAHHKVVGLDIAMEEVSRVNVLDARNLA